MHCRTGVADSCGVVIRFKAMVERDMADWVSTEPADVLLLEDVAEDEILSTSWLD